MTSPSKSFLIKDILSNKCQVISSNEGNKSKDLLATKLFHQWYYFNHVHFPVCPLPVLLKETHDKLHVQQDTSFQLAREFCARKKRKTRAIFTDYQIYALETYFNHQKYLTPSDRDQIADELHLSGAQVITWFQNRRAKLQRHYKEVKGGANTTKRSQTTDKLIDLI